MSAIISDPVSGFWSLKCGTCTAVFKMQGEMILSPDLQEAICPNCGVAISLIHLKGAVQGLVNFQKSLAEAKRPTPDHRRFSKVIPPGFEE